MVLNNLGDKYNIDLGTQSMLLPVLPPTSSFTLSKTVSGMTFSCSLSGSNISAMTFSCSNATQSALYGIK